MHMPTVYNGSNPTLAIIGETMRNTFRVLNLALLLGLHLGCMDPSPIATARYCPSNDGIEAKMLRPNKDKATLYIIRDNMMCGSTKTILSIDGYFRGYNTSKTFMVFELSSGRHRLECKTKKTSSLDLEVENGELYFVRETPAIGSWGNYVFDISLINPLTARNCLVHSRLIYPDQKF